MRAIIHRERTVELAFEDIRYFDLRRWREAEVVLNRPVHGVQIVKDESTGEFVYSNPIEVEIRIFLKGVIIIRFLKVKLIKIRH